MIDYSAVNKAVLDEVGVPSHLRDESGQWPRCTHARKQLRRRATKGGAQTNFFQCLDCGQSVGGIQKKDPSAPPPPAWNDSLEQRWREMYKRFYDLYTVRRKQADEAAEAAWQEKYRQHVNPSNPKWQKIRLKVLARCGGICEGCAERQAAHIHHLTYEHLGDELLFELRAVCLTCHGKLHPGRF